VAAGNGYIAHISSCDPIKSQLSALMHPHDHSGTITFGICLPCEGCQNALFVMGIEF